MHPHASMDHAALDTHHDAEVYAGQTGVRLAAVHALGWAGEGGWSLIEELPKLAATANNI